MSVGYDVREMGVTLTVRVSRHNDERDARDDAMADEVAARLAAAVRDIVTDPRYAPWVGLAYWGIPSPTTAPEEG